MVINGKPGYCFQNNELLAWALTAIGYKITRHLAKVIYEFTDEIQESEIEELPIGHEVLVVELAREHATDKSTKWIVDTGFANNSLREPLEIKTDRQDIAMESYRLSFLNPKPSIRIEIRKDQRWFCLSEFDSCPKLQSEINDANQHMFTSSTTPMILTFLKLARVTNIKRQELVRISGHPMFYRSYSSLQKQYVLSSSIPTNIQLNRHTLAVERLSDEAFKYEVINPTYDKSLPPTITGTITLLELQEIIHEQQREDLMSVFRDKAGEDFIQALKPYLNHILTITSNRSHTHQKIRRFTDNSTFCAIAQNKFNISLDECNLMVSSPQ